MADFKRASLIIDFNDNQFLTFSSPTLRFQQQHNVVVVSRVKSSCCLHVKCWISYYLSQSSAPRTLNFLGMSITKMEIQFYKSPFLRTSPSLSFYPQSCIRHSSVMSGKRHRILAEILWTNEIIAFVSRDQNCDTNNLIREYSALLTSRSCIENRSRHLW